MKKDTELWLEYAEENLKSSEVLLNCSLFNPCLQNAQQAVMLNP
jgi:HEPN domain-containing protein